MIIILFLFEFVNFLQNLLVIPGTYDIMSLVLYHLFMANIYSLQKNYLKFYVETLIFV